MGPLDDGHFVDVFVTSVQRHKVNRRIVRPGESSTLALNLFTNSTISVNNGHNDDGEEQNDDDDNGDNRYLYHYIFVHNPDYHNDNDVLHHQ